MIVEGSPEQLKSSSQDEHIVEVAFDRNGSGLETLLKVDPAAKEIVKQGDKYHIHTRNANATIRRIVEFATSAGFEIISLNTSQPSLEDVFVKYTGLGAVQLERMELLRAVKGGVQRG